MKTTQPTTYKDLLTTYARETDRSTATDTYTAALTNLATAVAYSVLKRCIDTSHNKALIQLRQSMARDQHNLDNMVYALDNAYSTGYNDDGDMERETVDSNLARAITDLASQTLGDGLDLVHDAVISILEQTAQQRDREPDQPTDLERPYTVRRLKRKIWIKTADSANGWETVTTTPVQEIYKAVRRSIDHSRAMQADPRNGYSYIEDVSTDPDSGAGETIYRRCSKYADIGGTVTDYNGKDTAYTADEQTVRDIDALVGEMELTSRQAKVLQLRMCGYGYAAIGTYLGVTQQAVLNTLHRIQRRAIEIGLIPDGYDQRNQ